jgi:N utilization substance protein B
MAGSAPQSIAPESTAPARHGDRRAARLCAVQALYQIVQAGADPDGVLRDFVSGRQGRMTLTEGPDGVGEVVIDMPEPDSELLVDLVRCATERAGDIRSIVGGSLAQCWSLERLEALVDCVLRIGIAELLSRTDIPAKATVSEFVEIAKAFYDGAEPGMVNAVLDRAARALGRLPGHE